MDTERRDIKTGSIHQECDRCFGGEGALGRAVYRAVKGSEGDLVQSDEPNADPVD